MAVGTRAAHIERWTAAAWAGESGINAPVEAGCVGKGAGDSKAVPAQIVGKLVAGQVESVLDKTIGTRGSPHRKRQVSAGRAGSPYRKQGLLVQGLSQVTSLQKEARSTGPMSGKAPAEALVVF